MANIDPEIIAIDSNNEYVINPYTIKYDSKAGRFFKGFGPKVGSTALISTGIFAGLTVAAVLTTGIAGATIAAIAGTSVGVGTAFQATYSGIVYGRNSAKSRFKNAGIGGREEAPGTIEIIEEYERRAHKYTQELEQEDQQAQEQGLKMAKKITLEDGAVYSRRELKKRIKESEDVAYHGLKYILQQGIDVSAKIEKIRAKTNPTQYEQDQLKKYWDIMDRIGLCVANMASNRLNYNPYKTLIIEALQKGCLLGYKDVNVNNQIREAAVLNDTETTFELYHQMYEKELLERNLNQPKPEPPVDRHDYDMVLAQQQASEQQLRETTAENQRLKQEKGELQQQSEKYQRRYEGSVRRSVARRATQKEQVARLRQEQQEQLKKLYKTIEDLTLRIQDLIDENQELEDQFDELSEIEEAYNNLKEYYESKEKVDAQRAQKKLDEWKANYKGLLIKVQQLHKKYENAVKRGWNQRAKKREAEKRAEQAESTVAQQTEIVDKQDRQIQILSGHSKRARARLQQVSQQNAELVEQNKTSEERAEQAEVVSRRVQRQNEILRRQVQTVGAVANKTAQENVALRQENRNNAELAENLGWDLHRTEQELARLQDENAALNQGIVELEDVVTAQTEVINARQEEIREMESKQQAQQYNFEFGQKYTILSNLTDRIEAHLEYTKANQPGYDKRVVQGLERIIARCRSIHPGQVTISDIVELTKNLRTKYEEKKSSLAKVSDKKLREYDAQIHSQQNATSR